MSCLHIFLVFVFFHAVASSSWDSGEATGDQDCKDVRYTEQCQGNYVQFHLHTRQGSEAVDVTDNSNNIARTKYNHLRQNIIIIHGYKGNKSVVELVAVRNAYLQSGDYNIWTPEFPTLVKKPCYFNAVQNVPYIGRCISLLVKGLRRASANPYIHIVGFSLGAHIAGRTGYEVRDQKVDRVTGLDPALPLFFSSSPGKRLSKDDAKFVDVVHTNMYMQGHSSALGHVDFYMNGGSFQPGCNVGGAKQQSSCNHHRAPVYFAESITSNRGFWGSKCNTAADRCPEQPPYEKMGAGVSLSIRGPYLVKTAANSPFALGYPGARRLQDRSSRNRTSA